MDASPIPTGSGPRESTEKKKMKYVKALAKMFPAEEGKLNPYKPTPGEILPAGYSRNYAGLLIAPPRVLKLDDAAMAQVGAELARLKRCVVIGKFLGELPQPKPFHMWLKALNRELQGGSIKLKERELSGGFFFLDVEKPETVEMLLAMRRHESLWGTCTFQEFQGGITDGSNLSIPD